MSTRRRYFGWGVFLVCLGAVPLAVQLGVLDPKAAAGLLRLWPLILIGIGLGLVLRMTPYRAVGGLIAGGVFGLVVGVFLAGGLSSAAFACTGSQPTASPIISSGSFATGSANVSIELSCGQIDLTRGADPTWSVQVATNGQPPVIAADSSSLDLRSANTRDFAPFGGGSDERWQVTLPATTSISAGVTLNAASGRLAFGNGAVSHVSATFNASDSRLDLSGAAGETSVSSTLNASSLRLVLPDQPIDGSVTLNVSSMTVCVPPTVSLRIQYSNTLGTENFVAAGLQGGGEDWSTPGIVPATTTLHITSNLSSITLDRSGECQ